MQNQWVCTARVAKLHLQHGSYTAKQHGIGIDTASATRSVHSRATRSIHSTVRQNREWETLESCLARESETQHSKAVVQETMRISSILYCCCCNWLHTTQPTLQLCCNCTQQHTLYCELCCTKRCCRLKTRKVSIANLQMNCFQLLLLLVNCAGKRCSAVIQFKKAKKQPAGHLDTFSPSQSVAFQMQFSSSYPS